MTSPQDTISKFKKNCIRLTHTFEAIVADCCDKGLSFVDPGTVAFVRGFLTRVDEVELMESFLERSHPHWLQIATRDETFFLENANDIFGNFSKSNVLCFKQLFETENAINGEDRALLWDFFEMFVKICYKAIKESMELLNKNGNSPLNEQLIRSILENPNCIKAIQIIVTKGN